MVIEQPHFDDEQTLVHARPVVPLERIEAKVKNRRRWFLGSAFVLAMLLGAASALVSAYFKLRNVSDPEIQTLSISESSVVPALPEMSLESVLPGAESTPTPRPVRNRDRATRVVRPVAEPPLRNEDDELRRIRDAVLVDEWQERRQRRAERRGERRERRRAARDSERDLSNLDEIFEGPRRP